MDLGPKDMFRKIAGDLGLPIESRRVIHLTTPKPKPVSKRRARAKKMATMRSLWIEEALARATYVARKTPATKLLITNPNKFVTLLERRNKLSRMLRRPLPPSEEARERQAVRFIRRVFCIP